MGQGKNWKIPFFLPFLLRYISGPVLAIIFSFAFPEFHRLRYDPMMISGFILSILALTAMLFGFIMPRYLDALVPDHRKMEGMEATRPNEDKIEQIIEVVDREKEKEQEKERSDGLLAGGGGGGMIGTGSRSRSDDGMRIKREGSDPTIVA